MKIRYILIAILIATAGYMTGKATAKETITVNIECPQEGCGFIDFDKNPELIGGGLVLEPTDLK